MMLEPANQQTADNLANVMVDLMLQVINQWPDNIKYSTLLCSLVLLLEGTVKDIEDRSEDRNQKWRKAILETLHERWGIE